MLDYMHHRLHQAVRLTISSCSHHLCNFTEVFANKPKIWGESGTKYNSIVEVLAEELLHSNVVPSS